MASTLHFAVVTPGEVKFEGDAEIVVAPGAAGDLAALANHAPMVTTLRTGVLRATVAGQARVEFAVKAGFMQILPDKVTVLTDIALAAADVDIEATRAELRQAEADLGGGRGGDDGTARAAIAWANARLEVAHRTQA